LDEALSQRSQYHLATRCNQKFIPETALQPAKKYADRRLAQVNSFAGTRGTTFGQQSIQCKRQPYVEMRKSTASQLFKNQIRSYIKYSFYKSMLVANYIAYAKLPVLFRLVAIIVAAMKLWCKLGHAQCWRQKSAC